MTQDVPHTQKLQILRNVQSTGCTFNGTHLDLKKTTLKAIRKTIGRKVPWKLLEQTMDYVQTTTEKREGVSTMLKNMFEGSQVIGRTFVVATTKTGENASGDTDTGKYTFTIRWADGVQSSFEQGYGKTKKHTSVTKEHISHFCRVVFDKSPLTFPTATNYPKEWFIVILVILAAYHHQEPGDDDRIATAQNALKQMNRKKKINSLEISIPTNVDRTKHGSPSQTHSGHTSDATKS